MIEPNQWQTPKPSQQKRLVGFSLSHTLINNHTESLPWPGKKERKEPFRQLLSSHAFKLTFSRGQSVQPQLWNRPPLTPRSLLTDTNLNHPSTRAVERSHLVSLGHCRRAFWDLKGINPHRLSVLEHVSWLQGSEVKVTIWEEGNKSWSMDDNGCNPHWQWFHCGLLVG